MRVIIELYCPSTYIWGIRGKSENEGGSRDDKTFNSGIRDKNISAGAKFAHFDRWDADSFKIYCRIRNEKREIAGYGYFADNCDSNQARSA